MKTPNAQYNLANPGSFAVRMATRARRRMYERFLRSTKVQPGETILDVGVTSDQTYDSSNYLEAWYPHKNTITAVGIDDASFLERRYPGVKFRRADGRALPFSSDCFDVVHSSAVLEHVGSWENQRAFIAELVRVARRAVFLTTPNRWFPIEFHSLLPFVHWLPKNVFRGLLRNTRYAFFAAEENLNLLGASDLERICVDFADCSIEIDALNTCGLPSNLLLHIRKRATLSASAVR